MAAKTVFEIRTENLNKLVAHHNGTRPFARRAGMQSSLVSRLMLWSNVDLNSNHRRMGEKLARKIEGTLGLADGWLDTLHDDIPSPALSTSAVAAPALAPVEPEVAGLSRDVPAPGAVNSIADDTVPSGLSLLQVATRDALVRLMAAGKFPDTKCLKLLQSWDCELAELEALPEQQLA